MHCRAPTRRHEGVVGRLEHFVEGLGPAGWHRPGTAGHRRIARRLARCHASKALHRLTLQARETERRLRVRRTLS